MFRFSELLPKLSLSCCTMSLQSRLQKKCMFYAGSLGRFSHQGAQFSGAADPWRPVPLLYPFPPVGESPG